MHDVVEDAACGTGRYELRLLGGFQLRCDDRDVETTPSLERLLSFLALQDRPLLRAYVAACLWPETSDVKACANLRTMLWRMHEAGHDMFETCRSYIGLHREVRVDVRAVEEAARRHRMTGALPGLDFVDQVRGELLPGFWDSWLVFHRERLRHEMIHLLEVVCRDALCRSDGHLAVLAALAAVECDAMRESSVACLIEAHLALGNRSDAVRAFRSYEAVLRDELGVDPGHRLASLVGDAVTACAPR